MRRQHQTQNTAERMRGVARAALQVESNEVQSMIDALREIADCSHDPEGCQSRMGSYECALDIGHDGFHGTAGGFTTWPDSADTRETIVARLSDPSVEDAGVDPPEDDAKRHGPGGAR